MDVADDANDGAVSEDADGAADGSSPGKYLLAADSLMMTTSGARSRSVSLKNRPFLSGIPRALW